MLFRKTRNFLIFFQASTLPSSLRETPGENALLLLLFHFGSKSSACFCSFLPFSWGREKQKGPFSPVVVRDCRGFFPFWTPTLRSLSLSFKFSRWEYKCREERKKKIRTFRLPPFLRRYGTGNDEGKTSYISPSSFSFFSYIFFAREE